MMSDGTPPETQDSAMRIVLAVLLMGLLAAASGKTVAARGAAGQKATTKVPSRYMMWQTQDKQPAQTRSADKNEEKVPIVKRLQKLLIVDVNQLPERWMALV